MNCCICSQIAGDPTNDLFARAVESVAYIRRVPIETENFAVIPSLGPLAPGHVILCPKAHYQSFATLAPYYDAEVDDLLGKLKSKLQQLYRALVHSFEHGMPADGSRVLCSVDHAHVHLVPASVSIGVVLEPYPKITVPPGLAGLRSIVGSEEYVFYESPEGFRCVVRAREHRFHSQFLRQAFARALGQGCEWNWREHMKSAEAHKTYERLANHTMACSGDDQLGPMLLPVSVL